MYVQPRAHVNSRVQYVPQVRTCTVCPAGLFACLLACLLCFVLFYFILFCLLRLDKAAVKRFDSKRGLKKKKRIGNFKKMYQ